MSDQQSSVLFIHALTSLHPGSGTALGVVDLPVQRERHTQWPIIPGSAIKGVLRDACRRQSKGDNYDQDLEVAFGPASRGKDNKPNNNIHAGALSFTDARILAFPVRSLRGVFAWVTCPAVVERFSRDRALTGNSSRLNLASLKDNEAFANKAELGAGTASKDLVLEEFPFVITSDCLAIADELSTGIADEASRKRFKTHLAVIPDDYFNHFVRHATEVVARIALDYATKTVKDKALFYQEFLPSETVFYSLVIAAPSRSGKEKTSEELLAYLRDKTPPHLQIGGDETTGKGLCALTLAKGA